MARMQVSTIKAQAIILGLVDSLGIYMVVMVVAILKKNQTVMAQVEHGAQREVPGKKKSRVYHLAISCVRGMAAFKDSQILNV